MGPRKKKYAFFEKKSPENLQIQKKCVPLHSQSGNKQ